MVKLHIVPAINPVKIAELASLEEDWDSYGARPISEEALNVLRTVRVVPTSDGGWQLEVPFLDGPEVEFVCDPSGVLDDEMLVDEQLIRNAWRWATYMRDGCWPPQIDDVVACARIEAFAIGRLGERRWSALRDSVPRYSIKDPFPADFELPPRVEWEDLLNAVESNPIMIFGDEP